jgi:hypothetical protein
MSFEVKHIRGIPYFLNGTTIYTLELNAGKPSETCVAIGTYVAESNSITYFPDWKELVRSNLASFHASISIQNRDKLRESIIKPQKQRKSTRNPRKTIKPKSAASE